jgi:hypothetical protein
MTLLPWSFKFWHHAYHTEHLILTPKRVKLLTEVGFMCSEAPTTGAMLRLEIKIMHSVCAKVPYHDHD